MVIGDARRRMNDALDRSTSVLILGSSRDVRALAADLSEEFDVTLVSDQPEIVSAARVDGIEAHEAALDSGTDLAALDLTADAAVVTAVRDRTNLLVTQFLRTRGEVSRIVVRVNDPAREDVFTGPDVETICSADVLAPAIRTALGEAT
jgi:trk system potassium uptake protein TrkA